MPRNRGGGSGAGGISATARLRQDYLRLKKDPLPYILAEPLPSNLLEWHYVVLGPKGSPYDRGLYHGRLVFPTEFPFRPPAIYMNTPNGRFATHKRLCLSISDYHPDTWNPAWSVGTILTGLLSFMLEKGRTLGSIETTDAEKRALAVKSLEYNLKDKIFMELFPELVESSKLVIKKRQELEANLASSPSSSSSSSLSSSSSPNGDDASGGVAAQNQDTFIHSAVANFLVIGGFAAFAFLVKHVIQTIAAGDPA